MTQYSGNPANYPANFPLVDDSAAPTAAQYNPALQALGDRTANTNAGLVTTEAALAALTATLRYRPYLITVTSSTEGAGFPLPGPFTVPGTTAATLASLPEAGNDAGPAGWKLEPGDVVITWATVAASGANGANFHELSFNGPGVSQQGAASSNTWRRVWLANDVISVFGVATVSVEDVYEGSSLLLGISGTNAETLTFSAIDFGQAIFKKGF